MIRLYALCINKGRLVEESCSVCLEDLIDANTMEENFLLDDKSSFGRPSIIVPKLAKKQRQSQGKPAELSRIHLEFWSQCQTDPLRRLNLLKIKSNANLLFEKN